MNISRACASWIAATAFSLISCAVAEASNLVVNPDFARTYAARRLAEFTEPGSPGINAQYRQLPSYEGKPFMPSSWMITSNRDGAGTMSSVRDGGKNALRIQTKKGESFRLRQQYVEVVPEASYTCGVSIKGKGVVSIQPFAENPATYQMFDAARGEATAQWSQLSVKIKIGYHRHLAGLWIDVGEGSDVQLREVEFSADLPAGATPEAIVTTKPQKDKNTLYFEDFDGATTPFVDGGQAKLTDANGGRFGRGLHVTPKAGGAKAKMTFGRMPERGTIEFWYKPDALPQKQYDGKVPLTLWTRIPDRSYTGAQFGMEVWEALVDFGFKTQQWGGFWAYTQGLNGWGWWQKETWHHFAGSWDGQVMRAYVDGVLTGVCYGKDQYKKTIEMPFGEAMEIELSAAGVIDEIRVSDVCRFGPIVPAGMTNPSFLAGQPPEGEATDAKTGADRPRLETSEKDLNATREKLLASAPDAPKEYTFPAELAKASWEGMAGFSIEKEYFGKGADGVLLNPNYEAPRPSGFYWKLEGVKPGKYYVGLWCETQGQYIKTEYDMSRLLTTLYHNGYPVRFSTTSDPVQVKPGIWLAELQSASAIEIKPGQEMTIRPGLVTTFARLVLYPAEPKRGHGVTGQTFGLWGYGSGTALQQHLVLQTRIIGTGKSDEPMEANIKIANPLPYEADIIVDWTLKDFFGGPLVGKAERVKVAAHGVQTIVHSFTAKAGDRAYQLDARTKPAPSFTPPFARPREMVALNDWTKLELLPWIPGPLEMWQHARMDLQTINSGDRMYVMLDGPDWELGPLVGRRVPKDMPADIKYTQRTAVPYGRYPLEKGVFGRWNRKKFTVPAWLKGQTYQITVDTPQIGAAHLGDLTIFLNGKRIEQQWKRGGESYSCIADVTSTLKTDGENELVILLRGGIAQVKDSYVDKFVADAWRDNGTNQENPGAYYNECNLGSVKLQVSPDLRVRQTLVLPDVETGELTVLNRIENRRTTPAEVEVRYQVFQDGKFVESAAIPAKKLTLKPGELAEIRSVGLGKGLRPYSIPDPALAKLTTRVYLNGKCVDSQEQRFGYRSMKVKGDQLSLNGKPISLLGTGCNESGQCYVQRETGIQTSRGLVVSDEFGDEIGRFTYPLICIIPVETWDQLNCDKLWEQDRANAVEVLWHRGNNPCNIGWDIHNECYWYNCYAVGLDGQKKSGARYASLAEEVWKRVSPDIWFLSDGDGTLGGRLKFMSWHYMNQGWSYGNHTAEHGFCDRQNGTSGFPPDRFFLDGAASEPLPTTIVRGTSVGLDDWKLGMPVAANEEFWFVGEHNGPAVAKYIGDRAALSSNWQYFTGQGMWWCRLSVQSYRDIRASVMGTYPINFLNMVMQNVTFTMPQQEVRYFGGATFQRRLNIHDDDFLPGDLEFTWKLLSADGKEVLPGQTDKMTSTTSFLKRTILSFEVPQVLSRTEFTLDMTLTKNGKVREHEQRIVEVWPASSRALSFSSSLGAARISETALYDPEGKMKAILERAGCKVSTLKSLTAQSLTGATVLVVGPNAAKAAPGGMPEQQVLRDFATAGGRVLVLPQAEGGLIPGDVVFEKRNYASMGFVTAADHPVMRGLKDRDFAMWNPGHLIVRGNYRLPTKGNFVPLVETYHMDPNLCWTPLWEMPIGRGAIIACQLPIVTDLDTEPMAAEMWRRLLGYLTGKAAYIQPSSTLALLQGASGGLVGRLKELRADFETIGSLRGKPAVAMVEMNQPDFAKQRDEFRKYIEDGGTLVLHRVRPEHKEWLESLTGRKVSIEIQPYRSWVDRQVLDKRDGLAAGLTSLDFYWRPNVGGEGGDSLGQVSAGVADGKGQVEHLVKVEGATEYLFPGGWSELKIGKGRLVIDQVKWELPEKDLAYYGSPTRVASMLLTNLGIVQKLPAPRPTLPEKVKYETIDLGGVVNRGLADDKPNDGIGWADWGPDQDLREFPTGNLVWDVPFRVTPGDKNAIVLRANRDMVKSLADYPKSVKIAVNKKNVAGLWFLHTGGWTNGATIYAWREIHYTDGSRAAIPLSGANFADWNYGRDNFPDEEETTTTVAWKGACKMYPVTRVYRTLWVNPYPQKEIKEIELTVRDLEDKDCRFVAHLAITAAVLPEGAVPGQGPRDVKLSQQLLQDALKLRQDRKDAQAATKLEEAIRADDQNVGAWVALTEIHAQSDGVDAFTALCRKWFAAMPKNYQAHNVLGHFLRKHGKDADALAQYQESIKLEWNQPPTINAIEELKKKLQQPK